MFRSAIRKYATAPAAAVSRPPTVKRVGSIRGGLVGFLLGVTTTSFVSYYYLLDEYKNANNVIVADIVSLQSSISNLENYVKSLEK